MIRQPDKYGREFAVRFQDQSVVDRYHLRPAYPPETFRILAGLISDMPRAVLDAGCGRGDISRNLLPYVDRIDAVDISLPMIERGKSLPGGDNPRLHWLHGRIEDLHLDPPYALITAGRSLHWMDWDVALPRFAQILTPNGYLAILNTRAHHSPWHDTLRAITSRYTSRTRSGSIRLLEELEQRHLFQKLGEASTAPVLQHQPLDDYIEALHSRSGFSRDYMSQDAADTLDNEVRAALLPFAINGQLTEEFIGHIVWGHPLQPGVEGT
jgi:trans-aconitate methyltransferase